MPQPRRMGVEGSKTRELLIEAAETLLREEGYAAVTARQVTAKAGLKVQLLYYYFQTMDELILAVVERIGKSRTERFEQALASADPLRSLWELSSNAAVAIVSAELTSLASHREAIRAEIVRTAAQFREYQVKAVAKLLAERGVDLGDYPAAGIVLIATSVARTINTEAALGLSHGHADAIEIVDRLLQQFAGPAAKPPAGPSTPKAAKKPSARKSRNA
jgi:TetR/AcrR family transcriptional regulator